MKVKNTAMAFTLIEKLNSAKSADVRLNSYKVAKKLGLIAHSSLDAEVAN